MKNIFLIFILTLFIFNVDAAKITDDDLLIGRPGSAADKIIKTSDGGFLKKVLGGDWFFSNDGILEKKIGSGSGSGGSGGVSILTNASFEDALTGWTNTGGTLTQETYTNGIEGDLKYARFVATAAGQYFESALITKSDNISGGCMMDFKYIQGDNAFEYKVFDSVGEISSGILTDLTEWVKAPTQTFSCKSQLRLRVISTAAGTIDVDDAYLGSNKGFIASENHNKSISYTPVIGGFGTVTGLSVTYRVTGDNLHIKGEFVTGTPTASAATIDLPSGFILFGSLTRANVGNILRDNATLNDIKHGSILATGGNNFLNIGISESNNSSTPLNAVFGSQFSGAGQRLSFDFTVNVNARLSTTQEAFTPEQRDFFISTNIGGGTPTLVATSGTPLEISNGSLDMVLNSGSAKIPCSSTNASTGLTCSAGNEVTGIVFNAPVGGLYKICTGFPMVVNVNGTFIRQAIVSNNSSTILSRGNDGYFGSATTSSSKRICDVFNLPLGENTMKLFHDSDVSIGATLLLDRAGAQYERDMNITVEMVGHNVSRPVIQNMVDTTRALGLRTEVCKINNNGTASKAGDLTLCDWLGTPSRTAIGRVSLTMSTGVFSGNPVCTMLVDDNAGNRANSANILSPTSINAATTCGSTLAACDVNFFISCTGAR